MFIEWVCPEETSPGEDVGLFGYMTVESRVIFQHSCALVVFGFVPVEANSGAMTQVLFLILT